MACGQMQRIRVDRVAREVDLAAAAGRVAELVEVVLFLANREANPASRASLAEVVADVSDAASVGFVLGGFAARLGLDAIAARLELDGTWSDAATVLAAMAASGDGAWS